ncbi:MAG: hypothetical protein ACR2LX_04820 [Jatrophihabitans sp.]
MAACSTSAAGNAATTARSAEAAVSPTASGATYSLYTHCGIREARVDSTFFLADHPLDDGQGNPPPGWGNPYQSGTITLPTPKIAVFRDNKGHDVTFHARPGATSYLHICS